MQQNKAVELFQAFIEGIDSMIGYCRVFDPKAEISGYLEEKEAYKMAISALEEIRQYREIGTIEQLKNQKENLNLAYQIINNYEQYGTIEGFREAVEIQKAYEKTGLTPEQIRKLKERDTEKAPVKDTQSKIRYTDNFICPNCGRHFAYIGLPKFCNECGQRIQWEE